MYVCGCMGTCVNLHVEVPGRPWLSFLLHTTHSFVRLFWARDFSHSPGSGYSESPRDLLVFIRPVLGLQTQAPVHGVLHRRRALASGPWPQGLSTWTLSHLAFVIFLKCAFRRLNLGPHACEASAFPTEPSSQPLNLNFICAGRTGSLQKRDCFAYIPD